MGSALETAFEQQTAEDSESGMPHSVLPVPFRFIAVCSEEEAGDPGRGAAHHIADRAEVSLRRALDNELIMHRADDETVAGRMGGRLSIPLPSGTAVPAPLREGSQGTRKGVKNRPAVAESLCNENLPRPHYPFCPPGIFPKGEDF